MWIVLAHATYEQCHMKHTRNSQQSIIDYANKSKNEKKNVVEK